MREVKEGSFCKYLQRHSVEEGLRMELKRTMHAPDGIGRMLLDIAYLQSRPWVPVLTICEADYKDKLPLLEQVMLPYGVAPAGTSMAEIADEKSHHTDKSVQRELFSLAQQLVNEAVPAALLQVFPCVSSFKFSDVPTGTAFLESHAQLVSKLY